MAMWLIPLVAVAPCQCSTPGGVQITSPGLISRFVPFLSCTQPVPEVTMSVWPAGWLCQEERAPGSNVTCPPDVRDGSVAANRGSTLTDPVKVASGPFADGRDPLGQICMLSARAGAAARSVSDSVVARSCFKIISPNL